MSSGIASGLAATALGAGTMGYYVWAAFESIAATRWPAVPGRIFAARVRRGYGRWPNYEARVSYSYEVMGTTYTGSRICFGGGSSMFEDLARAELDRYAIGRPVTVRYHPTKPGRSVLEPGVRLGLILYACFFALVVLGGLSVLGLL